MNTLKFPAPHGAGMFGSLNLLVNIVIAMVNGYDATCKRLVKYATSIVLVSLNSKYEPIMFTMDEVETKPVRTIGKVVELRGKF